jgi:energy-coupling factor transporter ATP-binding protein EcfA2
VSLITRESLSGVRVIRAFRREKDEFDRFRRAANDQAATAVAAGRLTALLSSATFVVLNAGVVAILWSGAFRVSAGDLTQGEVMAFVNYMTQTLLAVAYVANLVVTFTRGSASAQRIMEVLDASPALRRRRRADVELPARGAAPAVSLKDATFCYAGSSQPALAHVTLDVREGETLGIIGGTGSGKSTLVQLLPRLYDATSGSVSVLGRDVRDWPPRPAALHRGHRAAARIAHDGDDPLEPYVAKARRHGSRSCGKRSRLPRRTTSCARSRRDSTSRWRPTARTSAAASASASPSRAPSWGRRASWCWTTPPPRSTSRRTRA